MIDATLQGRIKEFLEKYRGFTPIEIAKNLDIKIVYPEIEDRNFAGAIKKAPNGEIVIYVNNGDGDNRQLFTIAHELGHFFLHREEIDNGIVSYRHAAMYEKYTNDERKREEEANHFAAELLMPEMIFREYFTKNSHLDREILISKMADLFGVSEDAIKVRMSYLDLTSI